MQDYSEPLLYVSMAIEVTERALRQEEHLQKTFRRFIKLEHRVIDETGGGRMPDHYVEAEAEFEDQVYFFVVALRQVVRARDLWGDHFQVPVPAIGQADLIKDWRDVSEHWDDPAKGRELGALARWRSHSDESEPGLSRSGDAPLRSISGLKVRRVRRELKALRVRLGEIAESTWDHCYLTPSQAARLLAVTEEELESLWPPVLSIDFSEDGLGLRYYREWVEARAQGHDRPPRWVLNGWL